MSMSNPAEREDYASVLRALADGELEEQADGSVELPEHLWSADVGHKVLVVRRGGDIAAALFRRWIGKGGNFRGDLYLPEEHSPALVTSDYQGRPIVEAGPINAVIDNRYDSNWCAAFFDED